jgi:hypothetical protein
MSNLTLKEISDLAQFMVEQIAKRPENIENNEVVWDYVADDVRIEFGTKYDDDDINYAIGMIIEAAYNIEPAKISDEEFIDFLDETIPPNTTIH